jgi:hypothetical protein
MTRLAIAVACGALAAGTAAQAAVTGVTGVTGTSTTQVQLAGGTFNSVGYGPGLVTQGGGTAYYSSFSSSPSAITFESANASARGGSPIRSTSTSSVTVSISNGGSTSVDALLHSQITAAGLGLYLADTTPDLMGGACAGSGVFAGGDPYGGCAQTKGGQTFAQLRLPTATTDIRTLGGAAFDFSVTVGDTQVYDFTGQELITVNSDGLAQVGPLVLSDNSVLQGLTHLQPGNPGSADGYQWDASDVNIALGALAAGASEDVVYTATVTTFSAGVCTTSNVNVCLVPYAAFGDPIGKGGISGAAQLVGPELFASPLTDSSDGIPFVDNWGPQTFQVPTFVIQNGVGVLTFNAIPEPKTWMSLILGFGLIGAALRRRRVLSYT